MLEYVLISSFIAVVVLVTVTIVGKTNKSALCQTSHGLGWTTTCATLYVANNVSNNVTPINLATNTAGSAFMAWT
jgi:hypothetical protein